MGFFEWKPASGIEIVAYRPEFREAFYRLNADWIEEYFTMEEADHLALDNPQSYILDRGGSIVVALLKGVPVGVCALLQREDKTYPLELAKMAVAKEARGKGVGWLLGQAIIEQAKCKGASRLYLESNSQLEPAIGLYHKLGFRKVAAKKTPYTRCNVQMELVIK